LNLKNVNILPIRAELASKNLYESFDLVTSRAVAKLSIIVELSAQFANINGFIVEPKSVNYLSECQDINLLSNKLGLEFIKDDNFISENNIEHHVLIFKKIKKTDLIYPRS